MGLFAWLGLERHWYYFDAWDFVGGEWTLLEQFQGKFTARQADTEYLDTFDRQPTARVTRRFRWNEATRQWARER